MSATNTVNFDRNGGETVHSTDFSGSNDKHLKPDITIYQEGDRVSTVIDPISKDNEWTFSEKIVKDIFEDEDLETVVLSAMTAISRLVDQRGIEEHSLSAEKYFAYEDSQSFEYLIRLTIDVEDTDKWLEIEDEVFDIADRSEVGEIELYAIVEQAGK